MFVHIMCTWMSWVHLSACLVYVVCVYALCLFVIKVVVCVNNSKIHYFLPSGRAHTQCENHLRYLKNANANAKLMFLIFNERTK